VGAGSVYACSSHMRHMRESSEKPIALIDMDGNWLQWGVRLNEILLRLDPSFPIVDDDKRTGWDDLAGPGADREVLREAMNHPDLYNGLESFPHSVEAILEMADEGWDVFHCSTPTWTNPGCVPGKLAAIDHHFGPEWADRLILTHDKTVVQGDILIDDKATILGSAVPTWKHLIHDQSHNRSVTGVPRMTDWREWRGHVYPLLDRVPV
jgi:5'-nucleotidase